VTRRIGIAQFIMLTAIAMARGGGSPAADWSETLEASASAAAVTNPQLQPGSNLADQSALLTVDGSTTRRTERGQLSVTPRFSITRYRRETGLDIDTGSIDFTSLEKLERGQWTFAGQALTDSTVTSELGLTGITNVNRRHDLGSVSTGYQYFSTERLAWQLQGTWAVTRYSDAARFGLTDYRYGSVQFGPTWSFSERLQGSLNIQTDRVNSQSRTTQRDYSVNMQLKRNLSERYAWRATVGATRVVDSGSAGSGTSSLLELGASRQGERIQWDVSVKRSIAPIGLGLLAREDQAALGIVAGTSERSTLNLSFNVIRADPVIFFRYLVYSGASWEQLSAEWKYNFSPNWSVSAAYLQARARSGNLQEWANGNQARLAILWQSGRL
jgi:hypothetical protein